MTLIAGTVASIMRHDEAWTTFGKAKRYYGHLHPSKRLHESCDSCPMQAACPLKFYIAPCVFKTIVLARRLPK